MSRSNVGLNVVLDDVGMICVNDIVKFSGNRRQELGSIALNTEIKNKKVLGIILDRITEIKDKSTIYHTLIHLVIFLCVHKCSF